MANETEYTPVTMEDGTVAQFSPKRNVLKTTEIDGDKITLKMAFRNGAIRVFEMNPTLLTTFAAHGMEAKYGDEMAGLKNLDDMVLAVDDLHTRLVAGNWSIKRESTGMAGASVLIRALVEKSGKSVDVIKAFLATKTNAEKHALRTHPDLVPIIARMEAGKAGKPVVDAEALLGELVEEGVQAPVHERGKKHHKG